jgi:hypothetical protein
MTLEVDGEKLTLRRAVLMKPKYISQDYSAGDDEECSTTVNSSRQ